MPLQFIVATIMTSALSTSHLRALKKRSSSPSGLSCFTILQNASLSSAGVWLASAALNSLVCPYLSSLVSTAAATSFAIFSVVAAGVVGAASDLPLRDRKRPSFFFFSGDSATTGAGVAGGDVVVLVVEGVLAGEETPKTTRVAVHSSFSFASSSFVRFPALPGNVFCGGGGISSSSFSFCFMIF